jgi:hypothetical protein
MLPTDLIAGPYVPPDLAKGDRTFCLYRDRDVVVTRWTDARIQWPRCCALGAGAGSGLLVNDELLRDIRTEAAVALKFWFGVSTKAVWNWRRTFGVKQWGTTGSRRLHKRTAEIVSKRLKGVPLDLTPKQRQKRSMQGKRRWKRWTEAGWRPNDEQRPWTKREIDLLGTARDLDVARLIDRSRQAVRHKRRILGIPSVQHRRWTEADDRIVLTLSPAAAALRLRRSLHAIYGRRKKLMELPT